MRTFGWPGDPALVTVLAERALQDVLGLQDKVNPGNGSRELINDVQRRLMPIEPALVEWVRDPVVWDARRPGWRARTGGEMLHQAARWLTWTLARAAVDVAASTSSDTADG